MTVVAVQKYQTSVGLNPTGYTGPLTRAKIKAETCGEEISTNNTIQNEREKTKSIVIYEREKIRDPNTPILEVYADPVNINAGGYTTINWKSGNVSYCSTIGGDKGLISGSEYIGPISATKTYTITCYGSNGSVSKSVTINVSGQRKETSNITVTSPNGGEQWEIGQLNTITWAPYGYNPDVNPAKDVNVFLERRDGTTVGQIMDIGKASLHTYFNIGSYNNFAEPGEYRVYIGNKVTGITDRSDALFTLLPRSVDLKVNGSDGPLSLYDNQPITVMLNTNNVTSCTLYGARSSTRGASSGIPIKPNTSVDLYAFAPAEGGLTAVSVHCFKNDGTTRGDAVNVNIAASPASLKVFTPNGGNNMGYNIVINQPSYITWNHTGIKSVSIALYKNDMWMKWIAQNVPAGTPNNPDGAGYMWTPVDNDNSGPLMAFGQVYKIYITGQRADGQGYIEDKSDAPFGFTTTTQTPTISESVKCVFNGATTEQKCWGDVPSVNVGPPTNYSCAGVGTCVMTVSGPRGTPMTWGSSCGGSANTSIDGNNDYANFSCASNKPPTIFSFTGPTVLEIDKIGTWTAQVNDPENDRMRYVVRWGDEPSPGDVTYPLNWPPLGFATEYFATTFTHAYKKDGTYSVLFYAVDNNVNNVSSKVLQVKVIQPTPAPTLTLTANPITITAGQSSTLTWSSTNSTSCTGPGSEGLSGTLQLINLTANKTYTFTCVGPGGSVIKSVTVTVNPATPAPIPVPKPEVSIPGFGGQTYGMGDNVIWKVYIKNGPSLGRVCLLLVLDEFNSYSFGQANPCPTVGSNGEISFVGAIPTGMKAGVYHLQADLYNAINDESGLTRGTGVSGTFNVTANPSPVSPYITASPSSGTLSSAGGYPTLWVNFVVTNYKIQGNEIVDFGDGYTSLLGYLNQYDSKHDYHTPGTYTVKLMRNGSVLASTVVTVNPGVLNSPAPTVKVTYPNIEGAYWTNGTARAEWTTTNWGNDKQVKIKMICNTNCGGFTSRDIATVPNSGYYMFTVPNNIPSNAPYYFEVATYDPNNTTSSVSDKSDYQLWIYGSTTYSGGTSSINNNQLDSLANALSAVQKILDGLKI